MFLAPLVYADIHIHLYTHVHIHVSHIYPYILMHVRLTGSMFY